MNNKNKKNKRLATNIIAGVFVAHTFSCLLANFSVLFFIDNLKIYVLFLLLASFVLSYLIDNSIISNTNNAVVAFATSFSLVYFFAYAYSGYQTPGGFLVVLISGSVFLALRKDIQQKCIHWFLNAFAVLFLLSLVEYVIDILTGRRFVVANVMRPVTKGFQVFEETLFNVIRTDSIFPRFQSLTEEPGVIGTLCGFLLFAINNNPKYRKHFYVFLTSLVLSFSLGGYVIAFIYFVFLKMKSIKAMSGVVALFIFMVLFFGSFFQNLIYERVLSDDVDNRTNETFDRQFYHAFDAGELWLGKGDIDYKGKIEGGNAGAKVWLYKYGFISFLFIFICYSFIFISICRNRKLSYDQIIFLIAFWASFYQRTDISSPHYLLPFVAVAILPVEYNYKSIDFARKRIV